ncbi:ATP-NAD kinase-like domain-containing protein [Scenedesmus sp. NREL 46B-D3]|nr:ATP-NAD kinase-like domain-containing protein [Scenedesmus sp. NREL 46B-D3]
MDAPMGEPANKDAPITLEKQQPAAPAISAGQDTQDQQQQVVSRKLLVILHGKRIEDDQVRDAIKQIQEEGHEVVVRVTWDSGDVDQFVKEAVELWDSQRYDTLVAGGGDGTLNEMVAALLKHGAPPRISIAQLPMGTANDLASAAGISLAPLDALRLALDPSTIHAIDVALVNGEVFMNLATAGTVSEVSSKGMSDTLKKLLGPAAVAVAGFRQLFITGLRPIKDVKLTLPKTADCKHDSYTADQVSTMSGDLLVLAAGQARQMGRMLNVCPDALLDDGLLDFTLLFGSPGKQAAALASDLLRSGFSRAQGGVQLLRLPWLVAEAGQDLKCNRDGEPSPPANKLVFEVLPRRIQLHLPDSRLLLEGHAAAAAEEAAAAAATTSITSAGGVRAASRR